MAPPGGLTVGQGPTWPNGSDTTGTWYLDCEKLYLQGDLAISSFQNLKA